MLEKSACDEDLRTPRHLLALGARDVWGGIQGRNQDSVFPSELEAEQKDYVILPSAAVTLIKISAKLTMMDLFALDSSVHGGRASVASCLEFQEDQDQTKPDTGYHNTHMAAAAVLCREEQNLPQSAGSSRSSNPPPTRKVDLPGPAAHPQASTKARRKRTATKV